MKFDDIKKLNPEEILNLANGKEIGNYVLPGLTSKLIYEGSNYRLRLFINGRSPFNNTIVPHSHRFNIKCKVIKGWACNKIFEVPENEYQVKNSDEWMVCEQKYNGDIGQYDFKEKTVKSFYGNSNVYSASLNPEEDGSSIYQMQHTDIHSIQFGKNSIILFEESFVDTQVSEVLLPWVEGETLYPKEFVEDWMFKIKEE